MSNFTAALIFLYISLTTMWYFIYKIMTNKKITNLKSMSSEAQIKQNPQLYKNSESLSRWGLEIDKDGKYQRIYNVDYEELYSDNTTETFTNE
jgi:hypothetical protein